MKNGLNISSVSEYVHEILTEPREANLRFGVGAQQTETDLVSLDIKTVRAGTIRIGRNFGLKVSNSNNPSTPEQVKELSPYAVLAAGLSGCIMITFVQGASARGITLESLDLDLEVKNLVSSDQPAVKYRWRPVAVAEPDQIFEVCDQVSCFSPNHRTATEANQIVFKVVEDLENPSRFLDKEIIDAKSFGDTEKKDLPHKKAHSRLTWHHGTECRGVVHAPQPNSYFVDQPKQLNGLDKAINPQEYILSALAADLVQQLPSPSPLRLNGKIDVRGLLNVSHEAVVEMQQIEVLLKSNNKESPKSILDEVISTAIHSHVARFLCLEQQIQAEIDIEGNDIKRFACNKKTTKELLKKFKVKTDF